MAKFSGDVGFVKPEKTEPGIVIDAVTKKHYRGDIIKRRSRWSSGNKINDDITITTQISIVCDQYIIKNHYAIKFVELYGILWNVESIDIEHPRIVLTLGGVYNGPR